MSKKSSQQPQISAAHMNYVQTSLAKNSNPYAGRGKQGGSGRDGKGKGVIVAILIVLLRRRFGPIGVRRIAAELVKVLLATAASAVVCLAMNRLLPPAMGTGRVMLRLIACAGASLIVYVAASVALGAKSLRALMTGIRR